MKQKHKSSVLLLDSTYTKAFLIAAMDSGYASLNSIDGYQDLFLDKRSSKRYRQASLEMALLFDRVDLFGVPVGIQANKLKDEGLLRLSFTVGQTMEGDEFAEIPADFIRYVKPFLIRYIHRKQNTLLRRLEFENVPYRVTSRAYDALAKAAEANINFVDFRERTLSRLLGEPRLLVSSELEYQDVAIEIFGAILKELLTHNKDNTSIQIATIPILESLTELLDFWTSLIMSLSFSEPLLSRFMVQSAIPSIDSVNDVASTYQLCRIVMQEKLQYAPVVETMDDVLRLREHKSISRFRNLLQKWCEVLQFGDKQALEEITKDIEKANKELQKLERWRKVDSWLFWIQVPAMFVPILSNIVTLASFSTGLWIHRIEENHSWLTIGR